MSDKVRFTAPIKTYLIEEGYDPMHFVTVTGEAAEQVAGYELVRRLEYGKRRGFGSVKVEVRLGSSTWKTSVFPMKEGGWFLPLKKPVRLAEGLAEGDEVEVALTLI